MIIKPQSWFQEKFLSSSADIVIGGGAAWSWKSFALLLEALRYINIQWYWAVIFRRTIPQIKNQWWLRTESESLYHNIWLVPTPSVLEWKNPNNNNKIKFTHMEYEKNKYDWQWSQIPFIWFDELTHFTEWQFRYLISRNRSTCWVKPYIRATCNPDPDSRVKNFIERRLDEDWYIIKERDWVVRYFVRDKNITIWWDSKEEIREKANYLFEWKDNWKDLIKSFTFIEGDIYENKELLNKDPAYLSNLMAQEESERKRLLEKNRNITLDDTCIFNYNKINDITSNFPQETMDCITCDAARFWRNLAVIMTWTINHIKRVDIFKKSTTSQQVEEIEKRREEYKIWKSSVLIDQDWVWWWIVDEWNYNWFSGGIPAMADPKNKQKENYKNLKTQCYYRLAKYINTNSFKIDKNFYVDWVENDKININWKIYDILKLIKEDLRSVKREKINEDWKLSIISKDKQKILLKWRSPDFGDSMCMRIRFDLQPDYDVIVF